MDLCYCTSFIKFSLVARSRVYSVVVFELIVVTSPVGEHRL